MDLDTSKAQALLGSAQGLRTHWSGLITSIMNFTIVTNVAVWTLFIPIYITFFKETQTWAHAYLAVAATISTLLLAIWRTYTNYLDHNIVNLYPELIFFEGQLSCPHKYGTSGYLERVLGNAGKFLSSEEISIKVKCDVIKDLIEHKFIGGRGHRCINWLTLVATIILTLIVFLFGMGLLKIGAGAGEQGFIRPWLMWVFGGLSIIGIILMIRLLVVGQRNPCQQLVDNIVLKHTKSSELIKQ
jgi:hypothetical protein